MRHDSVSEISLLTPRSVAHWARDLFARHDWAVLDTETTGLDSAAEVIEIAALDASGRTLLDTLVRPQGPIPAAATAVHGITADDVRAAPTFPELWPRLAALVRGKHLVIYNAAFDLRLLRQTATRYGLAWEGTVRVTCAMKAYAVYWGGRPGATWQSLEHACRQQAVPTGGHRALGDCRATLGLLRAVAATSQDAARPAPISAAPPRSPGTDVAGASGRPDADVLLPDGACPQRRHEPEPE